MRTTARLQPAHGTVAHGPEAMAGILAPSTLGVYGHRAQCIVDTSTLKPLPGLACSSQPPAPGDSCHKLCDQLRDTPSEERCRPEPAAPLTLRGVPGLSLPTVQLSLNHSCDIGQRASVLSSPHSLLSIFSVLDRGSQNTQKLKAKQRDHLLVHFY